jgi:hypothetical protein
LFSLNVHNSVSFASFSSFFCVCFLVWKYLRAQSVWLLLMFSNVLGGLHNTIMILNMHNIRNFTTNWGNLLLYNVWSISRTIWEYQNLALELVIYFLLKLVRG